MKTVTPRSVGERAQQFADLDDAGRVERVGGLVEHEQLGRVQQRAGEREALLVAQRELPGAPVGVRLEASSAIDLGDRGARGEPVRRRWMSRFSRTVRLG